MDDRAAQLIRDLELKPHPEGGHYREVYRSPNRVTAGARGERPAVTTIYFLLTGGEHSSWHVVLSDEVWHYYEGDPIELVTLDHATGDVSHISLGPWAPGREPVHVVPAGQWQAAQPAGAYTLVGCSVGPGFEFADFRLLRDDPATEQHLRQTHPDLVSLL
jgi:predicted cupin superfamily sugar epimerase